MSDDFNPIHRSLESIAKALVRIGREENFDAIMAANNVLRRAEASLKVMEKAAEYCYETKGVHYDPHSEKMTINTEDFSMKSTLWMRYVLENYPVKEVTVGYCLRYMSCDVFGELAKAVKEGSERIPKRLNVYTFYATFSQRRGLSVHGEEDREDGEKGLVQQFDEKIRKEFAHWTGLTVVYGADDGFLFKVWHMGDDDIRPDAPMTKEEEEAERVAAHIVKIVKKMESEKQEKEQAND